MNPLIPKCARRNERQKYDKRVDVYWDVKVYAGCAVSETWLEEFHKQTKRMPLGLERRVLGLDNWSSQNSDHYKGRAKELLIKLAYSPENCTDMCAVTDAGPGNEIKSRMVK